MIGVATTSVALFVVEGIPSAVACAYDGGGPDGGVPLVGDGEGETLSITGIAIGTFVSTGVPSVLIVVELAVDDGDDSAPPAGIALPTITNSK
jgi:hypothetical protein